MLLNMPPTSTGLTPQFHHCLNGVNLWTKLQFWQQNIIVPLYSKNHDLSSIFALVFVARESSTTLGLGFRCGFLGLLHMDVFHQRLEQEHRPHIISTVPTVPYIFEYSDGRSFKDYFYYCQ